MVERGRVSDDEANAGRTSHTRARASLTVEERVDHIASMMERLEWERGKTARVLAAEWGIAIPTVEGNAAEASRRVTGDRDEAARDITAGARRLFRDAVNSGNAKDAKAIGDLWASVSGANAPVKQEIMMGAASPTDAARLVREAFGAHAAQKEPKSDGNDSGEA